VTARTTKLAPATLGVALVGLVALAACAADAPPPKPPSRPPVSAAAPPPAAKAVAVDGSYYVPVDANVTVVLPPIDLPLGDEQIVRPDGAEGRWAHAPELLRDHIRRSGFAVVTGGGKPRLGELYVALRDARVPFVITMDTMLQIAHFAIDRMLADAEAKTMTPALVALLTRVGRRLDAESAKVTSDLDVAYDAARGLVGVGRALVDSTFAPAPDLAQVIAIDIRAVANAGPGVQESTSLGVPIDFAALAPQGALASGDAQLGPYRAAAWLGAAPLALASRADAEGGTGDVYQARTRTRAALLVARLLLPDVDPTAAEAYDAIARPLALVRGPSDDLSPRELLALAKDAKVDVRVVEAVQNVSRVDKVRRGAMAARRAHVQDGVRGTQVRLFGASAPPDTEVLQAFVSSAAAAHTLPGGLDLATWLGASEARTIVREVEPDEPPEYDEILAAQLKRRPPEADRHGSLLWTGLDAVSSFLGASSADGALPAASTWAWRRRKVEVALGGWATLRHDAVPFSRLPSPKAAPAPTVAPKGAPALGFVEPHPDAIARLVALVEQAARGLVATGAIERPPPGSVPLVALDLLRACLAVALREANDEPLEAEQAQAIAEMPGKVFDLETRLAASRGSERTLVASVHEDRSAGLRVVEVATGMVDEMYVVVREPRTGRLVLTVGASLAAHEWVEPGPPITDAAYRARIVARPLLRASWTAPYVVGPVTN
jgi:Protein of unknown function (DUF3160)